MKDGMSELKMSVDKEDVSVINQKENTEEKEAAYQMANIPGLGNKSIFKLLDYAGSICKVFLLSEREVYEILEKRQAEAFLNGRENRIQKTRKDLKTEKGLEFISYVDERYPERLRNIPDPPFCLYVKGRLPSESKPAVAIIGARACSEYGKGVAGFFGRELGKAGIQVISGMARGIDGLAQRGALFGGGDTFGVLGCGADVCYPPENAGLYRDISEHGGIISEYPPGTEAKSSLFPPRNRIISGLADLLLVVEARKKSGTYITVTQALEQGKDVFVVPGRITDVLSDGCNYLLTQGAGVAINPGVILEELKNRGYIQQAEEYDFQDPFIKQEKSIGTTMQDCIYNMLDVMPVSLEEIYYKIKNHVTITMEELLLELAKLQIAGRVIGEGNYYRRSCDL